MSKTVSLEPKNEKSSDETLEEYAATVSKSAPPILWHYTTPTGLLGILEQGALRATALEYLNDFTEGTYLNSLMLDAIKDLASSRETRALRVLLRDNNWAHNPMGVTCFCDEGDLLSQWRGYTRGKGFAIGFDSKSLAEYWVVKNKQGIVAPVQYSEEASRVAAKRNAAVVIEAWRSILPNGFEELESFKQRKSTPLEIDVNTLAERMPKFISKTAYLLMSGAFHKSAHFREEKEWRLVTGIRGKGDMDVDQSETLVSDSGLSLFRTISFQDRAEESPIRAIRMGPGLNFKAQKKALSFTLQRLKYQNINIYSSEVPLR